MISAQTEGARDPVVTRLPARADLDGPGPPDERMARQLDEVTLAAAKSARDYRSLMLENVRIDICAAPDDANALARADRPPDFAGRPANELRVPRAPEENRAPRERQDHNVAPQPERQFLTAAEAVEDYHAKAVELMNANVNAVLDYARGLAAVRSPAEFIALSTRHACRHFELIVTHTEALGLLSQSLAATTNAPEG